MPIRPENRNRYPADWGAIRAAVLERSRNCCEGSPAFPDCRAANAETHPDTGSRVVLTIAHLDHVPEHCGMDNLRAWCQRCHNTYDAPHRAANRKANREPRGEYRLTDKAHAHLGHVQAADGSWGRPC